MNDAKTDESSEEVKQGSKKSFFKTTFLAGIFATLPLVITLYVLKILYAMIASNISPAISKIMRAKNIMLPEMLTGILSVVIFVVSIFLVGILIKLYIGRKVFVLIDKTVTSIPFARSVYNVIKQMTDSFSSSSKSFEKVVMVDFPREGIKAVGFVIRRSQQVLEDFNGRGECYNVFVPTAPNPTSGFIMIIPASECTELPISVDEGLKYILSVGIINFHSDDKFHNVKNSSVHTDKDHRMRQKIEDDLHSRDHRA